MKRTMNRLFLRLIMLCAAVILGAFAVAHAQKGLIQPASTAMSTGQTTPNQAVPPGEFTNSNTHGAPQSGFNVTSQSVTPIETAQPDPPPAYAEDSSRMSVNVVDPAPADSYLPPAEDAYAANTYPEEQYSDNTFPDEDDNAYAPEEDDYYASDTPAASATYHAELETPGYSDRGSTEATPVQFVSEEKPPAIEVSEPFPTAQAYTPPEETYAPSQDPAPAPKIAPAVAPATPEAAYPDIDALPVTPPSPAYTDAQAYGDNPTPAPATPQANMNQLATPQTMQINDPQTTPPPSNGYGAPSSSQSTPPANFRQQGRATLQITSKDGFGGTHVVPNAEATGTGKPGAIELEGTQTPTLQITKSASREIQVGKPAQFKVTIRNIGAVDAHGVMIRDQVPHGTRLLSTNPPAANSTDGAILWQMGTVKSGNEVTATMEVMPTIEGDVGSVATVSFQAEASAKSLATRPRLTLEHTGPGTVLVGEDVIFRIKLSNPGTGVATNVRLEEDVPKGLRHVDGSELEYHVGTIRPGETRLLELTLKADMPGLVDNLLTARADSDISANNRCQVQVVAPQLEVAIKGPRRRYLERRANFEIDVQNPGTAPAKNVELVARLPKGLKFVNTNNAGQYNPADHAVYWMLTELPAQQRGSIQLTAVPVDMGSQNIRVESKAQMGLADHAVHELSVDGMAALLYTVTDATDPIEVGGQTTYEIHILNQGSKTGTNLRLAAVIDNGMTPISGEGPTRASVSGNQVVFEPLARLAPQADTLYKIHVKGTQPGDKRIQVQLMSDDITQPVTKEESTHIYSDE